MPLRPSATRAAAPSLFAIICQSDSTATVVTRQARLYDSPFGAADKACLPENSSRARAPNIINRRSLGIAVVPNPIRRAQAMRSYHQFRGSRRQVLQAGLAAGTIMALNRGALGDTGSPSPPLTKPIPGTGEPLPAVGLGTDKFRTSARDAIQSEIKRMRELGGTVIDTAAAYGDSEALIGDTLAELGVRADLFLATKLTAGGLFAGGAASFQRSLDRLRTQRVDLLQVHNLDGVDELMPTLQQWKRSDRIRYIGITTSRVAQHAKMADYMRKYPLDFIQVDYSLANRDAATTLLPLALERKIGVLANIPFGFGALFARLQTRALPEWAADIDAGSWGQFLLKYVISHPAVTCAIPGSTQLTHLEDNQRAARGRLPDEAMRGRMEKFWDAMA
ncbi:MAG TPA: aldo/keto reductase [Steroidobacteraceae bacterium]|nr:aldo/keto reductase [Steroidobacteraceae bacterium]